MVSHLKDIHLLYQKELGRIMCQLIHFCKKKKIVTLHPVLHL